MQMGFRGENGSAEAIYILKEAILSESNKEGKEESNRILRI